jgi:hypothetical protein
MLKLILAHGYSFNTGDHDIAHPFVIFNEDDSRFEATGYGAPMIKIIDHSGSLLVCSVTGSWTNQSLGIGSFEFTNANRLVSPGPHYVMAQLTKSGMEVGTERRSIFVFSNPS